MDPDTLLSRIEMRHQLSRSEHLVSCINCGGGVWAIVASEMTSNGGKTMAIITSIKTGRANPVIAQAIGRAQDRVDGALKTSFGKAWEEAWHECALLSLICNTAAQLIIDCRAKPQMARQVVAAVEESCFRVRARVAAVSSEFPRLVSAVRAMCNMPVTRAA